MSGECSLALDPSALAVVSQAHEFRPEHGDFALDGLCAQHLGLFQGAPGAFAGLIHLFLVILVREKPRKHLHRVRVNLHEASCDGIIVHLRVAVDPHFTGVEIHHQWSVPGQNAQFAVRGGELDHVRPRLQETSLRCHDLQSELGAVRGAGFGRHGSSPQLEIFHRVDNQAHHRVLSRTAGVDGKVISKRVADVSVEITTQVTCPRLVGLVHEGDRLLVVEMIVLRDVRDSFFQRRNHPHMQDMPQPGGDDVGAAADDDHIARLRKAKDRVGGVLEQRPRWRVQAEQFLESGLEFGGGVLGHEILDRLRQLVIFEHPLDEIAIKHGPRAFVPFLLRLKLLRHQPANRDAARARLARDRDCGESLRSRARRQVGLRPDVCLACVKERGIHSILQGYGLECAIGCLFALLFLARYERLLRAHVHSSCARIALLA